MFWSGRPDLNRRPPAPKAGALPGCATPRHNEPLDYTLCNFKPESALRCGISFRANLAPQPSASILKSCAASSASSDLRAIVKSPSRPTGTRNGQ
jgi:hypothetical protein